MQRASGRNPRNSCLISDRTTAWLLNFWFSSSRVMATESFCGSKALQHLMYGPGSYHASDLAETDYARIAQAMGVRGIRVEQPGDLAGALAAGLAGEGPTVIDLVVTRDPAKMLPAVDNRAVQVKKGDRVA
ncbi:MAG: hypothetical protein J0H91_09250 [Rhodospirillales bacterium]|nr:hypothetical protein [Rhodospirillales bacterium]